MTIGWWWLSDAYGVSEETLRVRGQRGNELRAAALYLCKRLTCQASFIRYTCTTDGDARNRLLFSNPANTGGRAGMTVRVSSGSTST